MMFTLRKGTRALVASAFALGGLAFAATPAAATHVVCGQVITADTTLDSDVGPCPADGLSVAASNITLDLNGFRVFAANGAGDNAGIRLGGFDMTTFTPISVSGVTVRGGPSRALTLAL